MPFVAPCPLLLLLPGTNFLASCNRVFGTMVYGDGSIAGMDHKTSNMLKAQIKVALLSLMSSLLENTPNDEIPKRMYDVLDFNSMDRQISKISRLLGYAGTTDVWVVWSGRGVDMWTSGHTVTCCSLCIILW